MTGIVLHAAVECPTPAYLNNGLVTYSGTTFTNEATYSCDYGYTLQGSTTRTCNANGGWQPSEPFCQSKCLFVIIPPY